MSAAWWGRESLNRTAPGPLDPPQLTHARARRRARRGGSAHRGVHARVAAPYARRCGRCAAESARRARRAAARATQSHAGKGLPRISAHRRHRGRGGRPARATLAFTVADTAPASALIPQGFQVAASAADGSGGRVIFETETRAVRRARQDRRRPSCRTATASSRFRSPARIPAANNLVFGSAPRPGAALLIGLSGNVAPGPNITFMIHRSARVGSASGHRAWRHRYGRGGGAAHPALELLRRRPFRDPPRSSATIRAGCCRAALVELRCPRSWRTGTPAGRDGAETAALAAAAARGGRVRDRRRRWPSSS